MEHLISNQMICAKPLQSYDNPPQGGRGGRESSLGAGEAGWAKTRGGGPPAWLAVIDKPLLRYASYLWP